MNIELSIVIPAYLEEENLRLLLPRLKQVVSALHCSHEILVIDTETALDGTESACKQNRVTCLRRQGGNDYGDAVRTGIRASRGELVIFMDADGSHPPEFLAQLYARRKDGDVVIASRYVEGGYTENPRILIFMSHALNVIYRLVLNLKCNDVSNSFKLYRGSVLRKLALYCNHFDIVEEILYKMSKNATNFRIVEVPFTFKKRMFGQTKRNLLLFVLTYIFTLAKLRFGK